MIEIDIRHRFGDFELEIAFRSDAPGTGLWGPSGSGKTTILNAISGLLPIREGRIIVNGRPLADTGASTSVPTPGRRIGYVFQEARLFPHLTVRKNLEYGLPRRRDTGSGIRLGPLAEFLDLRDKLDRRPDSLSGGEARRVALGRALLSDPELLLLDEPLVGLDAQLRGRVLPYLRGLYDRWGIPYLIVSHSASEMLSLVDHLVAISDGKKVAEGEPLETLFAAEPEMAAREEPIINHLELPAAGGAEDGTCRLAFGNETLTIPWEEGTPPETVRIAIGADEIAVAVLDEIPAGFSIRNRFPVRVKELHDWHGSVLAVLEADFPQPLLTHLTHAAVRELRLSPGKEAWALFKTSAIRIE